MYAPSPIDSCPPLLFCSGSGDRGRAIKFYLLALVVCKLESPLLATLSTDLTLEEVD